MMQIIFVYFHAEKNTTYLSYIKIRKRKFIVFGGDWWFVVAKLKLLAARD